MSQTTDEAARRAALCVKACEGLSDATLEAYALTRTVARWCHLEERCGELLELFERFKSSAPENFDAGLPCAVWQHIDGPLRAALEASRRAVK